MFGTNVHVRTWTLNIEIRVEITHPEKGVRKIGF